MNFYFHISYKTLRKLLREMEKHQERTANDVFLEVGVDLIPDGIGYDVNILEKLTEITPTSGWGETSQGTAWTTQGKGVFALTHELSPSKEQTSE